MTLTQEIAAIIIATVVVLPTAAFIGRRRQENRLARDAAMKRHPAGNLIRP
jgi:hypothetical protein